MTSGSHEEIDMYPNSALSAGQLAIMIIIIVVAMLCLALWIGGVFIAARETRHRGSNAAMTSLPQHPSGMEEPKRKAA
jgi:hypothetical protein